ncbi:MAG: o-succinylbenzoate synthase, partial [Gammaproteobacteria bacterium]|nr:o-succinylbenzoate synthase [Gammaproteobacteria bacterium]
MRLRRRPRPLPAASGARVLRDGGADEAVRGAAGRLRERRLHGPDELRRQHARQPRARLPDSGIQVVRPEQHLPHARGVGAGGRGVRAAGSTDDAGLRPVRIDAIEVREIRLPLRERFEISSGYSEERRILLVRLHADGETGWGECVAGEDPGYSYETTDTAWHILAQFLIPALLGAEVTEPADVERLLAHVRGHPMAKACLEMASWDLEGRKRGRSLAEVLGGSGEPVPVGVSVGLQKNDDLLVEKVGEFLAAGYRKIKLKIKPGRDVEMVRAVREAFPEAPLMVDANSAYTLADRERLAEMDDLDLLMIEQPLAHDDLHLHARLQEALETPVCLDESIRSAGDAELALELGSCRIINIKPGRVGGFGSSRRIHDLCRARGVPVWCGGM